MKLVNANIKSTADLINKLYSSEEKIYVADSEDSYLAVENGAVVYRSIWIGDTRADAIDNWFTRGQYETFMIEDRWIPVAGKAYQFSDIKDFPEDKSLILILEGYTYGKERPYKADNGFEWKYCRPVPKELIGE